MLYKAYCLVIKSVLWEKPSNIQVEMVGQIETFVMECLHFVLWFLITENCICKEKRQRCSVLYHKQKWCCWLYWYLKVGRLHPRLEKQRIVWKMGYKYETAWFLLIAAYSSVNLSFLSLLIKTLVVLWRNCESFQPEVHPRTELSSSILKHRPLSWGEWMFSDDKAYVLN